MWHLNFLLQKTGIHIVTTQPLTRHLNFLLQKIGIHTVTTHLLQSVHISRRWFCRPMWDSYIIFQRHLPFHMSLGHLQHLLALSLVPMGWGTWTQINGHPTMTQASSMKFKTPRVRQVALWHHLRRSQTSINAIFHFPLRSWRSTFVVVAPEAEGGVAVEDKEPVEVLVLLRARILQKR